MEFFWLIHFVYMVKFILYLSLMVQVHLIDLITSNNKKYEEGDKLQIFFNFINKLLLKLSSSNELHAVITMLASLIL